MSTFVPMYFLNEISETPGEVIVALDDASACFADDAMALLCRWAMGKPVRCQRRGGIGVGGAVGRWWLHVEARGAGRP